MGSSSLYDGFDEDVGSSDRLGAQKRRRLGTFAALHLLALPTVIRAARGFADISQEEFARR